MTESERREKRRQAYLQAFRHNRRDTTPRTSREARIEAYRQSLALSRARHGGKDCQLASGLSIRLSLDPCIPSDFNQRFETAFQDTFRQLPQKVRAALGERWQRAQPVVTIVSEIGGGQRSDFDAGANHFCFAWQELARLPDHLLSGTIARELAEATHAVWGQSMVDEGAAIRMSMHWGFRPMART